MPDERGKMRTLFVAGKFDDEGGRVSVIAKRILNGWIAGMPGCPMASINGGKIEALPAILETVPLYDNVIWMPDVSDEVNMLKLVEEIKKLHFKCMLVTDKQNLQHKHTFEQILHHVLRSRANLIIEFTDGSEARVLDPLGNSLVGPTDDFEEVGRILAVRTSQLASFTRVSSLQVGEKILVPAGNPPEGYYALIREMGEMFAKIVFGLPCLDNIFRCLFGFPSFRSGNLIFVSARNINEQYIKKDDFVAVNAAKLPVEHYGEMKPSIDTPIHIRLYDFYKNVNYIVHGHTYVAEAPFTANNVSCGAIEEAEEIFDLFPKAESVNFVVNLIGHGFIGLAQDFSFFRNLTYLSRERPEMLPNWEKFDYTKRLARQGQRVRR